MLGHVLAAIPSNTGKCFTSIKLKMTKTAVGILTTIFGHLRQYTINTSRLAPFQSCSSSDATDAVNSDALAAHPIALDLPAQGFEGFRFGCQFNRADVVLLSLLPNSLEVLLAMAISHNSAACFCSQSFFILSVTARKRCTSYLLSSI